MAEAAIVLDHVSKSLAGRQILRDVTLSVNHGDIFGYLGPNGAGKTTTIRIILGLMQATSGSISVLGQDVGHDATRRQVGFVLEADGLYDNMSAVENLRYYSKLYDMPNADSAIKDAIVEVGLSGRENDKVGAYSKGMRQRLALARAMVPDPQLLVLDEPTAGVDPTGQIEIRRLMLELIHKKGKTILLSSHNLDEVQRICNRIALIHQGSIRLYGELEKLQREMGHGGVEIETLEPLTGEMAAEVGRIPGVAVVEQNGRRLSLSTGKDVQASDIVAMLAARGVRIEEFKKHEASLEDLYTSIVKEAESK
jgi:ABC-2 type transport system ATP-binding protein